MPVFDRKWRKYNRKPKPFDIVFERIGMAAVALMILMIVFTYV